MIMTEEQKAQLYGSLLNEHTKLFNEISMLKSENINNDKTIYNKIIILERKQFEIMNKIKTLFS
jgi:hypothetical protein